VISGITLAIFKILVGLNGEAFKLPVYLFCLLSIGVAVSSVPLFISTFKKSKSTYLLSFAPVLATGGELIFNRLAIVFTVIGMGLGLATFVRIALKNKVKLPYVFIALDIVTICLMGTTGMMERIFSSATAHWIAEAINILNQTFFLISGILAFESCKKKPQKLNDKV
ncbi:MAG: hypothetical protein MJ208_01725, partial [Bacilli bacterium]|nr:hypothetical protein [Bacilli bacterium]